MNGLRRGQLYRLHACLGLIAALPLLVIAASGIILGFHDNLRYASAPYRLPGPVAHPLEPASLADAARAALPGGRLEVLYLPAAPERAARAVMAGERRLTFFLHPVTGRVLAVRDAERKDWLEFLRALHHGKALGVAGEIAAGATALLLPLLWLTGRPIRRGGLYNSGIHAGLGRITGGALIFLAATGGILTFAKPLRDHFYPPPRTSTVSKAADLSLAVEKAVGSYGRAPLDRIVFPARADLPLLFRFRDGGRVWLNAADGEVLRLETTFSPWLNLLYPLHSGRIAGRYGPPLVAALGIALLFLTARVVRLHHERAPAERGWGSR